MTLVKIANTAFHNVTMSEAIERIVEMVRGGGPPRYVCTGNLDHLVILQNDPLFRTAYECADLVLADGAPVVWLSRLVTPNAPLKERVAGSDLFWELGRASETTGLRLFFLGGAPGAVERAAAAVRKRFPGASICGTYCPPFEAFNTREEQDRIVDEVRAAQPDVLLVGLGAPKQEKWILANRDRLGVPVSIGVGGSFEMAGGFVRRPPRWVCRLGMEWFCRMMQEPRRLWRRYILRDLPFFLGLFLCALAARNALREMPSASASNLLSRERLTPSPTTTPGKLPAG